MCLCVYVYVYVFISMYRCIFQFVEHERRAGGGVIIGHIILRAITILFIGYIYTTKNVCMYVYIYVG